MIKYSVRHIPSKKTLSENSWAVVLSSVPNAGSQAIISSKVIEDGLTLDEANDSAVWWQNTHQPSSVFTQRGIPNEE